VWQDQPLIDTSRHTSFSRRFVAFAAVVITAIVFACGGVDNISRHKTLPIVTLGPNSPWGEPAIDRRLHYDGRTFRLKAIQDAQFVDSTVFTPVGFGSVEGSSVPTQVFVSSGEVNRVYTTGAALEPVGPSRNENVPQFWYRWETSG
jgi:hypothetical protein